MSKSTPDTTVTVGDCVIETRGDRTRYYWEAKGVAAVFTTDKYSRPRLESVGMQTPDGIVTINARRDIWSYRKRSDYYARPRVYVGTALMADESWLDDLSDRARRPVTILRDGAKACLDDITKFVRFPTWTMAWNQYAGCTCPCSPGFIMKVNGYKARGEGNIAMTISLPNGMQVVVPYYDFHISLTDPSLPRVDSTKAGRGIVGIKGVRAVTADDLVFA